MPKISVILPVYNGQKYLRPAIESILNQTYTDFELIVLNDGSTDNSLEIIKSYIDPRIIIVDQKNIGSPATLNVGLKLAKGEYIARQDHDDVARKNRFIIQSKFLDDNPDVAVVGSWASIIGFDETVIGMHKHPFKEEEIRFFLNFNNPFVHSSLMFRREIFATVGGYSTDPARQPPDDFELLARISKVSKLRNIPEILQEYREVRDSISRKMAKPMLERLIAIASENIQWYFNTQDQALAKKTAAYLNGATGPLAISDYFAIRRLLLSAGPDGTKHRPLAKKILFKAFVKSLVRKPWKI